MRWQLPTVTFATSCWEKDWRTILLSPDYLKVKQIENHRFPFAEKVLIINNVHNLDEVKQAAQDKVDAGVLTRFVVAEEVVLSRFDLKRSDFSAHVDASADWVFYNALAPLAAIDTAQSDYLLYLTGDVTLDKPVNWIGKALRYMKKHPQAKVANLTWNDNFREAKKESYKRTWNFYVARWGFSDQMFLVKTEEFRRPIYGEIHPESGHYPRGDVWEKRVFSFLINRQFERITYRRGSYTHDNIL